MTSTAVAVRSPTARAWWWRHPELPASAAITTCWVGLGVAHLLSHSSAAPIDSASWSFAVLPWMAMIVAMMLPGSLPMLRRVAFDSIWRRRHHNATLFAATYVATWTAVAVGALAAVRLGELLTGQVFAPGPITTFAVLVAAAGWQFAPAKRRFLRRCHLRTVLLPRGWSGDRSVIHYGAVHARACIGSCGPAMAAMFVTAHDFHLMVPLAIVMIYERLVWRPNLGAGAIALVSIGAAGLLI